MDSMDYNSIAATVEQHSDAGINKLKEEVLEEACHEFTIAYDLSHMLNDKKALRACAFNLGATYIADCKFEKGVEILLQAFPPLKSNKNRNGDLYYNLGRGYEGLGDKGRALDYYKKAAKDYEKEEGRSELLRETQQRIDFLTSGKRSQDAMTLKTELWIKKAKERQRKGQADQAKALADKAFDYLKQSKFRKNKGMPLVDFHLNNYLHIGSS